MHTKTEKKELIVSKLKKTYCPSLTTAPNLIEAKPVQKKKV